MNKRDPHDCAPDQSETVLLLIDVINDFDFPEGRKLLRHALPAAKRILSLKKRMEKAKVPTIYVNDNFGRWKSDFKSLVDHCMNDEVPGSVVSRILVPAESDYFVLKPKHSGFFSTSLHVLLSYLGAKRLIITGFAADICVLFTANDAYMLDYELVIPPDCIAAETKRAHMLACKQMKRFLKADTRASNHIRPRL